ncbi:MAG: hypothetical protein HYZ37_13625 [Candidatus Solibacter usitatus]|nr:hypothetical protein [Candidatus Solibacter usitatus]
MSFLDNLENNLKSLESREERDPEQIRRDQERREAERQDRIRAAPFAAELRNGPFTQALLGHATRIGFSKRVKVNITWLDTTLRLDARDLRLELQPDAEGVVARHQLAGEELQSERIELKPDAAAALAERWLSKLA